MTNEFNPTPKKQAKSGSDRCGVPAGKVSDADIVDGNDYQQQWARLSGEMDFAETVIRAAKTLVLVLDPNGRIMHFNAVLEDITGYRIEEVRGRDWFSIFPPESDAARIRALFLRTQGSIPVPETVTPIITFDGKRRYIDWSMKSLINEHEESVGILMVGRDITQRRLAEHRMRESLEEKEVLLREICHRTRNTMQIISGLTSLQCASITDSKVLRLFRRTDNRIKSLALVHRMLYQADSICEIDLKTCFQELIRTLADTMADGRSRIEITTRLDPTLVSVDTAIPCGLILNEALSNSLEYAFPAKAEGRIDVMLTSRNQGKDITIRVRDNGVGFSRDKAGGKSDSLGFRLMTQLAEQQLGGRLTFETGKETEVKLEFRNQRPP